MKKLLTVCIVFLTMCTIGLPGETGQKEKTYDLRYQMKEGQTFDLLNLHVSNRHLTQPVKRTERQQKELKLTYRVIAADREKVTFEVEYQKKDYLYNRNGEKTHLPFDGLKGKKIQYDISVKGQTGNFNGLENLPKIKLMDNFIYQPIHYQQELEHMVPFLPKTGVKIGSKWIHKAFGMTIEYTLMDELKHYGHDCVRIFARIQDDPTPQKRKDGSGREIYVSRSEPFTDIYYFAYKKGMLLSRFSVCSLGELKVTDLNKKIIHHRLTDILYETYVTFK